MENDSLESLQLFLEDPIYLLPSDRLKLLEELGNEPSQNFFISPDAKQKEGAEPTIHVATEELDELKNINTTPSVHTSKCYPVNITVTVIKKRSV